MQRTMIFVAVVVLFFAGQALAFQCPKLAAQIDQATALRFDPTAADAKVQKEFVMQLHNQGKHAEAEQLAKEVLGKLGVSPCGSDRNLGIASADEPSVTGRWTGTITSTT